MLLGLQEAERGKAPASSALLEEAAPGSCKDRSRRESRNQPRWPADLEVLEQIIDPAEVKVAPQAWRCIGEEVSEALDFEPARFFGGE